MSEPRCCNWIQGIILAALVLVAPVVEAQTEFSKAFNPDTIFVGEVSTLEFSVLTGTGLSNLDFTDNLPSGVVIATPSNASTDCPGATLTANAGQSTITFADAMMSAESDCNVNVDVTSSTAGSYDNVSSQLTSDESGSPYGTATATLIVNAPPGFSKAFSPDTIFEGGVSTLTFTIDNTGATIAASNFAFTDNFPAGVVIADPTNAATTCAGGMGDASAGAGSFSFAGGSVAADISCTIQLDVTSNTADTYVNTTGDLTSSSGNSGTAVDSLTVIELSGVGFSKVFLPDTIGPGSTTTLRFDIDNSASGTLVENITFTDVLPAGITIATPASAFTNCTDGVLSAPDGGGTVSLSGGRLGAFASCSVTVNVTGTATATNNSGNLTSSAGNSGAAVATLTVDTMRLGFAKSFAPDSISLGSSSTLTFIITNNDDVSKSSISFTDPLPAGMVIATLANVSNTCGGFVSATPGTSVISLSGGSVGGMSSCVITVDVTTSTTGVFVNTTLDLTHGAATEISSGFATAALEVPVNFLSKVFLDDPVVPGGDVTLQFTIQNPDRVNTATAIAFTDPLPAGLTALAPLSTGTCNGTLTGTTTLMYSGGSLAGGASCSFSVTLMVPSITFAGNYTNTTSAITATIDGDGVTGNMATDDLVVSFAPIFTKEFIDDPAGAGDAVTLRFTITNSNPDSSLTDIEFSDDLNSAIPGLAANSLVVSGVPVPLLDVCGMESELGVFAVNIGGTFFTDSTMLEFSGGSLAVAGSPGDSCSFDVSIDIPAGTPAGAYLNTSSNITGRLGREEPVTGEAASGELVVIGAPRLLKEFLDDPVDPGGMVTLQFILSHDQFALGDASGITFTDDLAATLPGLTATGLPLTDLCGSGNGSLTGTAMDTSLTFSGATLVPGETCSFTVTLEVPDPAQAGRYTNTTSGIVATILGNTTTGNAASDDLEITGLVLSKEFTDDPVLPGGAVTLRFTLANMHPSDNASNIDFTDNLGTSQGTLPGLVAEAPLPDTSVCGAGSTISGTTVLSFANGSVNAGMACSFDVLVRVPASAADGIYNNTTSFPTAIFGDVPLQFDPATDALTVNANLLFLTKEFTDDPVLPGSTVNLEFTLTNQANEAVSDIGFSDDLDAALSGLVATGLPISACGGTLTGSSTISLTGGSLAASGASGDLCTFAVTLAVPSGVTGGSTFINTTSQVTGTIGNSMVVGDAAIDELDINFLTFSKAFSNPAVAGDTTTLTFTIENEDTTAGASNLGFTDDLDTVLAGLVATGLPISDVCGSGSVIEGTSFLTLSGGNLLPGGTCTIAITLDIPLTAAPGIYSNTTSNLSSAGLVVSSPASDDLEVTLEADLSVTKTDGLISALPGGTLTYTIVASNAGPSADPAVNVSDSFPTDLTCTYTSVAAGGASGNTAAGSSDLGETLVMPPGSSVTYTVDCMIAATAAGTLSNTAAILTSGDVTDPVPGNNVATDDTLLAPDADLSITKTDGVSSALPGGTLTYTIVVGNAGPSADPAVSVSDSFPADLTCTYTSIAVGGASGNTAAGAGDLNEMLNMPAGSSVTYTVDCAIAVSATGTLQNTATVTASVTDPDSSNNSATDNDTVLTVVGEFSFTKMFTNDPVAAGGVANLEFTISNLDPVNSVSNIAFSDNLEAVLTGLEALDTPRNDVCGTGSTLTGTSIISLVGGSLAVDGGCTFSVTLRVPADAATGIYTNTTGPISATIDVTAVTANALKIGEMASDGMHVVALPILSKAFNNLNAFAGGTVDLTFTITNVSTTLAATDISFNDDLGAVLPGLQATGLPQSTICGSGSQINGASVLIFSGGSLVPGASCQFAVTLAIPSDSEAGIFTNITSPITATVDGETLQGPPGSAATAQLEIFFVIPVMGIGVMVLLISILAILALFTIHLRRQ